MPSQFAFNPQGNTVAIAAATTAPTPVQIPSAAAFSGQSYEVQNIGTVSATLVWGVTAAIAAANAIVASPGTSSPGVYLASGTDKIYTFPAGAYFTAITTTGTCTILIGPGDGV